jgi:hypothetical protein
MAMSSEHEKGAERVKQGCRLPLRYVLISLGAVALALLANVHCSEDTVVNVPLVVSSRSYQGHASDADINNFVRTYPFTVGTRLDDCQTCHTGGTVNDGEDDINANACDYCHYIIHPPVGWTGLPTSFEETLNPYGAAYNDAGRDAGAVTDIALLDSDGDGYDNADEIAEIRYPGFASSYPGLALCPMITVTLAEIQAMPAHTQFGLANTTKQQYDFYATYTGVKIKDLLEAKCVDITGATSIDILAPDGFAKTFTIEQITEQYPDHRFFSGFGAGDLGNDCAFVEYPTDTYGLAYGAWIGQELGHEQWHILAYEREGQLLEESYLDLVEGRIAGEGPYRNIIPPGSDNDDYNTPDRGKGWDVSGCEQTEWNYDYLKDHNAGSMVKGAVIIRINPMPDGCEEFDIINGGWAMIDAGVILIYGHNVTGD